MIHPKKGSPSGRNAYPVTEKIEELKEEEKNDMAKKKTFQEYTQEALLKIEKTENRLIYDWCQGRKTVALTTE